MIELNGKYANAKVFTDIIDDASISQIIGILNIPFSENQTVRMMPDVHAGAGCTVGTTMTITDKICPNLIGVDIGCGMNAIKLQETDIDFNLLDTVIRQYVPSGFSIRSEAHKNIKQIDLTKLYCYNDCDILRAEKSIGTLGGGNHFIEIDKDSNGNLWLVIHSGSRHLGTEVAKIYQKAAIKDLHYSTKEAADQLIAQYKAEHRHAEISDALKALKPKYSAIPDDLCWCEGELFEKYIHDMKITQRFAVLNRQTIADVILKHMDLHQIDGFETIHNYLDTNNMILRKGSVSAQEGERLLIPMNMRDGSLICIGKGNPDWNYSAPHGAGRLMSRAAARENLSLDEFEDTMKDVWTTSVGRSTIDESPMAYKPMEAIVENIKDTVDIVETIKPVYNFKAGE